MIIKRTSFISGIEHELDLDVTEQQLERYESGQGLIQDIFDNLPPWDREFIKTGITRDEWDDMFRPLREEDEDIEEDEELVFADIFEEDVPFAPADVIVEDEAVLATIDKMEEEERLQKDIEQYEIEDEDYRGDGDTLAKQREADRHSNE